MVLEAVEIAVKAVFFADEFFVISPGDEVSILHDVDHGGVADGGEAVGDDDGGAALHEAVEGLLDVLLGLAIEGRGGFV